MSKGVDLQRTENLASIGYILTYSAAYTACGIGGGDFTVFATFSQLGEAQRRVLWVNYTFFNNKFDEFQLLNPC